MIKSFQQRWRSVSDVMAGLFFSAADARTAAEYARREPREAPPISMFSKGANVDEYNVTHAAERMARLGATVRVLVVLADGMTRGSSAELQAAVKRAEGNGTIVLGIGIGEDTVETVYPRYQIVERPETLARSVIEGVKGSLRKSLITEGFSSRTFASEFNWKETTHV